MDPLALAQTCLAGLAILLGPETIKNLYQKIFYKITAVCTQTFLANGRTPTRWKITIWNRTNRTTNLEIYVFPQSAGNRVRFVKMISDDGGGVTATCSITPESACLVKASRLVSVRRLDFEIDFATPDIPLFQIDGNSVRVKLIALKQPLRLIGFGPDNNVSYFRMMVLMLQFIAITSFIGVRLLWFAF